MAITLRLKNTYTIPISIKGIIPARLTELNRGEFEKLPVQLGNQATAAAEIFDIDWKDTSDLTLRLEGDLQTVSSIGCEMENGTIVVSGDAGDYLGCQMKGGQIEVEGSVGQYAAAEMSGGTIRVAGNASDWLAAALPGSKAGVSGGDVFVAGGAGYAAAFRMRRGNLIVQKNVGRMLGWEMLAGTIVVGGCTQPHVGKGMVRGTIMLISTKQSENNIQCLPATFSKGGQFRPSFMQMLGKEIDFDFGEVDWSRNHYTMFHGDHLKGGRGEIFVPTDETS